MSNGTLSLFDRPGLDEEGSEEGERPEERIFRVSEINRAVNATLESQWSDLWIEGELSDVKRAASGHVYFCLNDEREQAQLRGVMFRSDARRAKARLARGEVVRLRGRLSLFEPRGNFQLIARLALPAGEGDLHAQFERIRRKLESEGLLDPARKRKLPHLPTVVGVATSAAGAALHDIIRVAGHRCPVRIVVADCRVQGQDAPASIVRAIQQLQRLPELDVLIVGRGGGAQEDLWCFNHESVARAIAACRVPTVSAVGHEVDVTIADLVADVRASTPSNAAELVVPDREALRSEMQAHRRHLERALETRIGRQRLQLERLARRVADPRHAVGGVRRRLDHLSRSVGRLAQKRIAADRNRLAQLHATLVRHDARATLARDRRELTKLTQRLETAAQPLVAGRRRALHEATVGLRGLGSPLVTARRARVDGLAARLDALSPKAVLARGYAIALHGETGKALCRADEAKEGDALRLILHEGELDATVRAVRPEGEREEEPEAEPREETP